MKRETIEEDIIKIKNKIKICLKKNKIETALYLIRCASYLLYKSNIQYKDKEIEDTLKCIAQILNLKTSSGHDDMTILFYDSVGIEYRGLSYIYIKALINCGYHVEYVIEKNRRDFVKRTEKLIQEDKFSKILCLEARSELDRVKELNNIIYNSQANHMILYTTPMDGTAVLVWNTYIGIRKRYIINLTDHAFWLGINAFDYCIEFRSYGGMVSKHNRGISTNKIKILPYYPVVDKTVSFKGLPFDWENNKFVFSGGSLYKTLDKYNKYYCIVDAILSNHKELIFLYAGYGDTTQLYKLKKKYPERLYHIDEREDLMEIMKRCYIYLSTYPFWGGLMTQYAIIAKKLPLTLKNPENKIDILLHPEKIKIEYDNEEELLNEVAYLLDNVNYKIEREKLLIGQIVLEQDFKRNLNRIIRGEETDFILKEEEINADSIPGQMCSSMSFKEYSKGFVSKRYKLNLFYMFPIKVCTGFFLKCCAYIKKYKSRRNIHF